MRYTTVTNNAHVHTTRIEPLDREIVRIALSVRVPEYRTKHTDSTFSVYTALAHAGTAKKSKLALLNYVRKHGITFDIATSRGVIQYMVSVRKKNVSYATALLDEIIFLPTVSSPEFKVKKQLLLEGNREAHDDAKRIARIAFTNMLYAKESSLHELTLEDELKEIKALREKDLHALQSALQAGEWFVSYVGDDTVHTALTPLIEKLGKHASAVPTPTEARLTLPPKHEFVTIQGKTNIEVRIGNVLPISPLHEDYTALSFGIDVLGKVGGFSGRLMSTVREKEGLTYGIYATTVNTSPESTTHWNVYTFFTAKDFEKGIRATEREIALIVKNGITAEELTTFKEIEKNQYLIAHESNLQRLGLYHRLAVAGYSEDFLLKSVADVQALTLSGVNKALKTYINPKKIITSGAGPITKEGEGIL